MLRHFWLISALALVLSCGRDTPVCGEGTHESGGVCVPAYGQLFCGPGTLERDGHCVIDIADRECGSGAVLRNGQCVGAAIQDVELPFEAGTTVRISQGFHGYFSHKGSSAHAVDIPVEEGTRVTAARGGTVLAIREDSNTGCGDVNCADQANYVIIDHGDGTIGQYWHLEQNGALVALGDAVCAGQVIGLSGNTGFSTGPHLHFQVADLFGQSLPLRFHEQTPVAGGVPTAGRDLVSTNAAPTSCAAETRWSDCPSDIFSPWGVWMEPGSPCSVVSEGIPVKYTGRSVTGGGHVVIERYYVNGQWAEDCVTTDEQGWFSTTLSWSSTVYGRQSYFIVVAADEECHPHQGWDASIRILLR